MEPSVHSVRTPTTVLNLVDLARLDRLFPCLDHARKVVWMNRADERPVLQLFTCITELLQGWAIQELHFAHSTGRGH